MALSVDYNLALNSTLWFYMSSSTRLALKTSETVREDDLFWALERILLEGKLPFDRSSIRRALSEAENANVGEFATHWSIWLSEAAVSLGLRARLIQLSTREFVEFAEDGSPMIGYFDQRNTVFATTNSRRRRVNLAVGGADRSVKSIKVAHLRRWLASQTNEAELRVVAFEGQSTAVFQSSDHHDDSPVMRLRHLLAPEKSDIGIVIVFAVVNGFLSLASPIAVEALVNTVALGQLVQPLIVLSFCVLVLLSFSAGLKYLQTVVVENIQRRLFARVAGDLAYRLPRLLPGAAHGGYLPELVNRFFEIVTVQKTVAQLLLDGTSLIIGALVGMMVLAFYHPWLLGIDLLLVVLMAFALFFLGKGAVATSIKESKKKYAMAAWLEDLSASDHAFRYAAAADFALERADQLTYDYLLAREKHFRVLKRQVFFMLFLQAISSTVLLSVGGWLVMQGQLSLGQLVAAELIVAVIVGSFAKLGKHVESFYDLLTSVDKLGHLFDLPTQRRTGVLSFPQTGPMHVEFRAVSYTGSAGRLASINDPGTKGERLAITGRSGSGKSTLLKLICGWLEPTTGEILLDGIAAQDLRPDVIERNVAIIQSPELFSGTIAENVHLGRTDITIHEIRQALERVGVLTELQALPSGLETEISRSGTPLTDLHIRRITLARAIVAQPRLLLIDSLLDAFPDDEAESLLRELASRDHQWTLILVTGREALVRLCDRAIRLPASQESQQSEIRP